MKTIVTLLALLILSGLVLADDAFDQFEDSLSNLIDSAQYDQALAYLQENTSKFTQYDFEFSDYEAQIYLNQKEYKQAYQIWSTGHQKGFFYLLHPALSSYSEIKDDTAFLALSQKDLALRQSANDSSLTIYEVALPENYSSTSSYPLLLVLHGGRRTIEQSKNKWQADWLKNNFITVYLQSYRHYNYNKYGWASGDLRSRDEIAAIYNELLATYNIDRTKILVGGISAGGSMALDLALNNIIPINGLIGICPGKPTTFADTLVEQSKARGLKIFFVSGETDFYKEAQLQMTAVFDTKDLMYEHYIVEGLGHDYPENFPQWLERSCVFLLQN